MGKKSRAASGGVAVADRSGEVPVVGMREPCPCGSGRRYKACHGRAQRAEAVRLVSRPFEGLPGEADWVALREIVPAATAVRPHHGRARCPRGDDHHRAADGLAGDAPRGRHRLRGPPDPERVRGPEPGRRRRAAGRPRGGAGHAGRTGRPARAGPRLQDVLEPGQGFDVTVHPGFDYWLAETGELTAEVRESMERANAAVVPTTRLEGVEAAYWCEVGPRRHLRWVLTDPEERVLDGLARLHAADASSLGEGSRYVGAFRADGLIVPVWDLAPATSAEDLEAPAAAFAERLGEAMAVTDPLTADERRARAGVVSRQLTLR